MLDTNADVYFNTTTYIHKRYLSVPILPISKMSKCCSLSSPYGSLELNICILRSVINKINMILINISIIYIYIYIVLVSALFYIYIYIYI